MMKNGKPLLGRTGHDAMPLMRGLVLPAAEWRIEDTWHVAGLKGSGSHHIALADKVVPETSFFDCEDAVPCPPGPLYQTVRETIPVLHSAFPAGMTEGHLANRAQRVTRGNKVFRLAHREQALGEGIGAAHYLSGSGLHHNNV